MKKTWTTSITDMKREFAFLIEKEVPLTFCQHGCKASKMYLHHSTLALEDRLVLERAQHLGVATGKAIIFYQGPLQPLRGLEVTILKTADLTITTTFPTEIFQVDRRRVRRVKTAGKSLVSFIVEGSSRLSSCKVKDISPEGAQFTGKAILSRVNKLAPMTFSLGMRYDGYEKRIIVSEALIVRIDETENGVMEYGIHFNPADAEQDKLEEYILYRRNEDSDMQES